MLLRSRSSSVMGAQRRLFAVHPGRQAAACHRLSVTLVAAEF
jgi:hypothetical protein